LLGGSVTLAMGDLYNTLSGNVRISDIAAKIL